MSDDTGMDDRIAALIDDAFEDEVVSHWIMVAEVVNSDAQTLRVWTSGGSTRWLVRGMLHEAEDMILGDEYETQLFDEDDDEE